jgi:hypothetical protein
MTSPSGRDKNLDNESKRLKSEAENAETPRERAQFEKYSRFFDSIAEDGRPDGEEEDGGAADDNPVRGE